MSHVYDNWGKLVAAVEKREQNMILCYCESLSSSFSSISSDFTASSSSRRLSFDPSSSDQLIVQQPPQDGNSQSFATTSSVNSRFDHVPKPPNVPSGSRFDKIFGAARRFVTPVRKRPETQMSNLPQDINAPEIQSGYSASKVLEVKREIPTVDDAYALSFNELKEQTCNFGPKTMISEGFYGSLYFARLKSGKVVALKMLHALSESDSNDEFLTKVSMVSRFKHENLVEFLGYSIESYHRILAYEFAKMGTLHDFLHGSKARTGSVLDWMQRVRIAVDTARGLEYLHENAVVHKDIRSSNVLLFNDFKAKIGEINLSSRDPDDYPAYLNPDPLYFVIPPRPPGYEYHAPEFFMVWRWTQKSDVYSFGVVLLELLTGRAPVDDTLPRGELLVTWAEPKLRTGKIEHFVDPKLMNEFPPKAAAKLAAVAKLCVQFEAERRPDMKIVVKALEPLLKATAPAI